MRKEVDVALSAVLGTAQLASPYGVLGASVTGSGNDAFEFLRRAEQLGFAALDTAPAYPGAEEAIGEAEVALSVHTKFDPSLGPKESITGSLRRLRRTHVAVAYLHDPDALLVEGGAAVTTAARVVGEHVGTLGASVYTVEACRAALENYFIGVVQIPVNPLKRDVVDVVRSGRRGGVRVLGRSLLAQGLLAADEDRIPAHLAFLTPTIMAFRQACQAMGRTPLEVCLLWARDHPDLDGIVIGAASLEQLSEVAAALGQPGLNAAERDIIDALDLPDPNELDPRTWAA